ncbi:hypothetical protein LX32DRAFT_647868 [Colletotrichum zoysiae]|uniref:Uncharacterized protein n=1 Tax=Colletotrichum zoysiae TaxID=1216348 RepID=A0AAD9HTN9_9PEZI|nr:hypothetical protein LX32DRAFT_647868 [Colletotrichum zoysiae]
MSSCPYAGQPTASPATAYTREPGLMTLICDVAFIASIIVLVREGVRKMSSPKPPSTFFMGTPTPKADQALADHGSHEQLIGISRATFLRCRKRQQVREYDQRRVVEASWAHLLRPAASWGRSRGGREEEEGEERDTAVRFAEVVEYIPPAPVGSSDKQRQPCRPYGRSELEKPAVGGEEAAREGADQDGAIATALEIADEDGLDEIVDKIWKGLHPEEA